MPTAIESLPPLQVKNFTTIINKNKSHSNFNQITLTIRGRNAISHLLNAFKIDVNDFVLLPAYTCDTVTAPLRGKCKFQFYDINEDFSLNINQIEILLKKYNVKILYIIHYFGFLHKNLTMIRQLCDHYGCYLIEDHAHSALSDFNYDFADAKIFSFRKLIPVPDGGGIWLASNKQIKYDRSRFFSDLQAMSVYAKRKIYVRSQVFRTIINRYTSESINSINDNSDHLPFYPASHFSEKIIRNIDLVSIIRKRRKIFEDWLNLFKETRFELVFDHLPDGVTPLGFPIRLKNPNEVKKELEKNRVFLKIHWPVLPVESQQHCPVAHLISKSIITLPVIPELTYKKMNEITTQFKKTGISLTNS